MENLTKENNVIEVLKQKFGEKINARIQREKRVIVETDKDTIEQLLLFEKENMGYKHLAHISCVDWLEENEFEIVYITWSPEEKINILNKIRINRENPVAPNIDYIWRQANTYEREMREMYGIEFPGLVGEYEFILEDWNDKPPMRRDFDTLEYVMKTYTFRPGREDAKDVRETIANRTGEEIPEFAKKYSRQ